MRVPSTWLADLWRVVRAQQPAEKFWSTVLKAKRSAFRRLRPGLPGCWQRLQRLLSALSQYPCSGRRRLLPISDGGPERNVLIDLERNRCARHGVCSTDSHPALECASLESVPVCDDHRAAHGLHRNWTAEGVLEAHEVSAKHAELPCHGVRRELAHRDVAGRRHQRGQRHCRLAHVCAPRPLARSVGRATGVFLRPSRWVLGAGQVDFSPRSFVCVLPGGVLATAPGNSARAVSFLPQTCLRVAHGGG